MKTAIYIEESIMQIVLTPENEFEKNIVENVDHDSAFTVRKGSFYETAGAWMRLGSDDCSLMLVDGIKKKAPKSPNL